MFRSGLFGRQHVRFGLIALGAKECVSLHLGRNRVGRNSRQNHRRRALRTWRGRRCRI